MSEKREFQQDLLESVKEMKLGHAARTTVVPAVSHNHEYFLIKARQREGFGEEYEAREPAYQIVSQLIKARTEAGLTQEAVAERMGATKSAVSRIESAGKHLPTLSALRRYAAAVGCEIQILLVRTKAN